MSRQSSEVLEWHRVSVLWRVLLLWLLAVVLIMTGMVGTGLHLFAPPSFPPETRTIAGMVGWPSAVMGPVVGIIGILRVLSSETRTLVVCRKGLRLEGFGMQSPIPWSSLKGMAVRGRWPRTVLILNIETGGERGELTLPSRWIGMSGQRLCSRVLEIQRRALLGVPERLPEP